MLSRLVARSLNCSPSLVVSITSVALQLLDSAAFPTLCWSLSSRPRLLWSRLSIGLAPKHTVKRRVCDCAMTDATSSQPSSTCQQVLISSLSTLPSPTLFSSQGPSGQKQSLGIADNLVDGPCIKPHLHSLFFVDYPSHHIPPHIQLSLTVFSWFHP